MNTADQLISGYTAYTSAEEFGALAEADAPATTPSILVSIDASSAACGASIGMSISKTIHGGC
ncbi:LxmA leader domain family RiPP [Streptomyces sp. NPDC006649]|uniref:LxmA leader domain family RiPP n=1 Tax=Streptomyces sp. NPDC006649 TaxID=3156896 RepID=UPI0033AE5B39